MTTKPKILIKGITLLLAGILLLLCFSGCKSSGKTLMQIGGQKLSVNIYELMLSRMKGTLSYNGYPTETDAMWDEIISTQGATMNDYFCLSIQEEAKKFLIKLYLFEEVYKLTLPEKNYEEIDTHIAEIIDLQYDGSKTDFNRELSKFGVNMNMLRENYIMEDKIDYLMSYLSSQTADTARDEYYRNNYVRFRQIVFPLYEFLYERDDNGDIIYYKEGSVRIAYDLKGETKKGTDGNFIKDENGDTIYFTSEGKIAYDQKNGIMKGIDKNNDGYTDYEMLSEEEAQKVVEQAQKLNELLESGDFSSFEMYGVQLSAKELWEAYPHGNYINLNKSYSIEYLDGMQEKLKEMKVGDIDLVSADNAYHLIMKYELENQGYSMKENSDWFEEFEDEMVEELLNNMCQKYIDQVQVNADILAKAMDMKKVGANPDY